MVSIVNPQRRARSTGRRRRPVRRGQRARTRGRAARCSTVRRGADMCIDMRTDMWADLSMVTVYGCAHARARSRAVHRCSGSDHYGFMLNGLGFMLNGLGFMLNGPVSINALCL